VKTAETDDRARKIWRVRPARTPGVTHGNVDAADEVDEAASQTKTGMELTGRAAV